MLTIIVELFESWVKTILIVPNIWCDWFLSETNAVIICRETVIYIAWVNVRNGCPVVEFALENVLQRQTTLLQTSFPSTKRKR